MKYHKKRDAKLNREAQKLNDAREALRQAEEEKKWKVTDRVEVMKGKRDAAKIEKEELKNIEK